MRCLRRLHHHLHRRPRRCRPPGSRRILRSSGHRTANIANRLPRIPPQTARAVRILRIARPVPRTPAGTPLPE